MQNATSPQRSPTNGLLLGLVITLAAVLAYAFYITVQLAGLRKLQSEMVDRNRKDSLQLLRVQNDLNSVALAMRDMLDTTEPYPLTAWTAQLTLLPESLRSFNRCSSHSRISSSLMRSGDRLQCLASAARWVT